MLLLLQAALGAVGVLIALSVGVWLGMRIQARVAANEPAPHPDPAPPRDEPLAAIQALLAQLSEPEDRAHANHAIEQAQREIGLIVESAGGKASAVVAPVEIVAASSDPFPETAIAPADSPLAVIESLDPPETAASSNRRRRYEKIQYMAICREGRPLRRDSFIAVECHDIGTDGMSFHCPAAPDAPAVVISLGDEPNLFFMLCEVESCRRINEVNYLVDCHFVERIGKDIGRWNVERRAIGSSVT